ncbi:hypothetical protein [Clostridium botulinum]|nr:hypothetical protein [Clostridium botulinum]MCD3223799.1 hypothetical protein [Clostridium botulinum C/D]MCD3295301.1 hypothetical protein [Clostridium botulinum C/D]
MKIIIMRSDRNSWYSKKLGKTYDVKDIKKDSFLTKDGLIKKSDAQII